MSNSLRDSQVSPPPLPTPSDRETDIPLMASYLLPVDSIRVLLIGFELFRRFSTRRRHICEMQRLTSTRNPGRVGWRVLIDLNRSITIALLC